MSAPELTVKAYTEENVGTETSNRFPEAGIDMAVGTEPTGSVRLPPGCVTGDKAPLEATEKTEISFDP